jgi:hypothetical protein
LVSGINGWTLNVLYAFKGAGWPETGLIFDNSGNLYGGDTGAPDNYPAYVYKLTPSQNTWVFSTISYLPQQEVLTQGSLAMDSLGNLYGTSYVGGKYGVGCVFELVRSGDSWTYLDLYDFTGLTDGASPFGGVLLHKNGKLYGTASVEGAYGHGVVWEITP